MPVDVAAHITGTVWKIQVKVGDHVAEEQAVVILESMKMEMPVESPAAGRVASIAVSEGQAVEERWPGVGLREHCQRRDLGEITRGLGQSWELAQNTYKPYPCGIVGHPIIDGGLELHAEKIGAERLLHLAAYGLAVAAGVGGARQHRVLGGDPAFAAALAPAGHALAGACGAQHPGVAEGHQDRAFRVLAPAALDGDGAELIRRTAVKS